MKKIPTLSCIIYIPANEGLMLKAGMHIMHGNVGMFSWFCSQECYDTLGHITLHVKT